MLDKEKDNLEATYKVKEIKLLYIEALVALTKVAAAKLYLELVELKSYKVFLANYNTSISSLLE